MKHLIRRIKKVADALSRMNVGLSKLCQVAVAVSLWQQEVTVGYKGDECMQ